MGRLEVIPLSFSSPLAPRSVVLVHFEKCSTAASLDSRVHSRYGRRRHGRPEWFALNNVLSQLDPAQSNSSHQHRYISALPFSDGPKHLPVQAHATCIHHVALRAESRSPVAFCRSVMMRLATHTPSTPEICIMSCHRAPATDCSSLCRQHTFIFLYWH